MTEFLAAPTNAQPAAAPPAPEPYQIPFPGPSPQIAAQPAAPTVPMTRLADYLGAAEPAAPTLDPAAAAEAAIRAEEGRQSDILTFCTPPETIAGYQFQPPPPGVETSIEQEVAMRTLFRESGIPSHVGSEANRLWNQAILNPPSEIDRTLQGKANRVALEQAWGPDFERNLAAAQSVVAQMAKTRPEVINMLEQSGLGNNVYIIRSLYNLARARGAK